MHWPWASSTQGSHDPGFLEGSGGYSLGSCFSLERHRFILLFLYGRKIESGALQECLYPSRSAFSQRCRLVRTSQVAPVVKNPAANAGDAKDVGSIPGWGRSPGGGNDNPLQYSCRENSLDRGNWRAPVHGATETRTWRGTHTLHNRLSNTWFCFLPLKQRLWT